MIRKIFPFLMTACLLLTLTGCTGRDDASSVSSTASATTRPTPTPEVSALPDASGAEGSGSASSAPGGTGMANGDYGVFTPFREALQGVYGESYSPDTRLSDEEIRTELGLDESLYEEVFAENVSGGKAPDMFIAVKAKEGKAEEVEKKLNAYKEKLAADETMSAHADKIEAAQVYAEGDYVFFLLTSGTANSESSGSQSSGGQNAGGQNVGGESSQGAAETLGENVQRGIDAIKEALGMM